MLKNIPYKKLFRLDIKCKKNTYKFFLIAKIIDKFLRVNNIKFKEIVYSSFILFVDIKIENNYGNRKAYNNKL